jgi:hypothetical protein
MKPLPAPSPDFPNYLVRYWIYQQARQVHWGICLAGVVVALGAAAFTPLSVPMAIYAVAYFLGATLRLIARIASDRWNTENLQPFLRSLLDHPITKPLFDNRLMRHLTADAQNNRQLARLILLRHPPITVNAKR